MLLKLWLKIRLGIRLKLRLDFRLVNVGAKIRGVRLRTRYVKKAEVNSS